jgi:hypothetical protein
MLILLSSRDRDHQQQVGKESEIVEAPSDEATPSEEGLRSETNACNARNRMSSVMPSAAGHDDRSA